MELAEWMHNNHQPSLALPARVVAKRTAFGVRNRYRNTSNFATFELSSGERREYGLLAEHDQGALSFQGTRYLGFKIDRPPAPVRRAAMAMPPPARPAAKGYCPNCGGGVRQTYKFCPHCGQPKPDLVNQT